MAEVMAESGYNEEDIFDCGICGEIVFLVVVPLIGACRVPVDALSHFMAGADEYTAEGMPEHWYGTPSGKWTIKRDRLRILQKSWEAFSVVCEHRAHAYDALFSPAPEQADTQPQAVPVVQAPASKTGQTTIWTDARKAEASTYREKHGLKKTAEHYQVSQATISKHIPAGKPQKKPLGVWGGLAKK